MKNFVGIDTLVAELHQSTTDKFDYHVVYPPISYDSVTEVINTQVQLNSFKKLQVIVYDEYITSQFLIDLHNFLRSKSCNIENILLVTTHSLGTNQWWETYKKTMGIYSFSIIEASIMTSAVIYNDALKNSPDVSPDKDFWYKNKKIEKLFSYFGGAYSSHLEKEYVLLKLLEFKDISIIDYLGEFPDLSRLVDHFEYITYYMKNEEIEVLKNRYNLFVHNKKIVSNFNTAIFPVGKQYEQLNLQGLLFKLDSSCLLSVARETIMWDQVHTFTEKTLKSFIHHQLLLPTCGETTIEQLSDMGFEFDTKFINYEYLKESDFASRIEKMCREIQRLAKYSNDDLQDYYFENFDRFQHNANHVLTGEFCVKTQKNFKNNFLNFLLQQRT